jgi:CheY-like chemotaxis protein
MPTPGTLVLDDGELEVVRHALEEIGIEYTYLRGGAVEGLDVAEPRHLLVANARRALSLPARDAQKGSPAGANGGAAVRIVVTSEDSNALRDRLRAVGFDDLVRQPVHPSALRLLLLRALYRGPERRVAVRYPVGGEVAYRTGLRKRSAVLVEIALRGCRLQLEEAVEPDTRITVYLPKPFTGDARIALPGWVVRCQPAPRGGEGFEAAVAFETLKHSVEAALREVLKAKIHAGEIHSDEPESAGESGADAASEDADSDDRRSAPRSSYARQVLAIQDRAARVLMGRNLSMGGMLVEQSLELGQGDETRLAIFGRDGDDPILVRARAVREDAGGMALQFFDVADADAVRLEALVGALPEVERLADGETEAMGTVVAEIVGD